VTPDLERLADEAIELRTANVDGAIGSYHIPIRLTSGAVLDQGNVVDHLDRARNMLASSWAAQRPALAQLANDRLTTIAALAAQGVTPEAGCTVTVGRVTLEAVQDLHPVAHRYRVIRGREQAGWAWLSSDDTWDTGTYIAAVGDLYLFGPNLRDVLEAHAEHLDTEPLTGAGAR
jgi:hypothetical protein